MRRTSLIAGGSILVGLGVFALKGAAWWMTGSAAFYSDALETLVNAAWAWVLIRAGRAHRSPALAADGRHLLTDVVTSIGIALGVILVILTGLDWLDPLLAAAVALYVLWEGTRMIGASANVLLDVIPPQAFVDRVRAIVAEHGTGAIEAHDLRMREAGASSFLEFDLVVPGTLTVSQAHDICDRIEAALHAEVRGLRVTIHVEPDEKAKHTGVIVL